ncbi:MAG: hypothetical protein H6512_11800 [Acidimicrobiia bacterium]|nr:hypothetical protein [Acidimicrobiia bacterium]
MRSFADLEHFVEGRLFSTGLTEAALAAAATVRWAQDGMAAYDELSTESDARYPTEPLRDAPRRLGRQLLRVAAVSWPDSLCDTLAGQRDLPVHQPVALGAVGAVAGITPCRRRSTFAPSQRDDAAASRHQTRWLGSLPDRRRIRPLHPSRRGMRPTGRLLPGGR